MKTKFLTLVLISILFFTMFIVCVPKCNAENGSYVISFAENPSAKLIKTQTVGDITYAFYDFIIILYNSGSVESDIIAIQLTDDFDNYTQEDTIGPGEYKTFTFDNHPIEETGKQTLTVSYFPIDRDKRNKDNTGSTTITVGENNGNDDDSSPGFEVFLIIVGIINLIIFKKRKKKIT